MDIMCQSACLIVNISRFIAMFSVQLYDGGSGLRLSDGSSLKPSSFGWCLKLVFGWAQHNST